jgi:hypothetical protein
MNANTNAHSRAIIHGAKASNIEKLLEVLGGKKAYCGKQNDIIYKYE